MAEPVAILVAARDEDRVIAATVATLRNRFPAAEVIVADDGSRDETAAGPSGQAPASCACHAAARGRRSPWPSEAAAPGPLLLCDADLTGDLGPLLESDADLAIAAFSERQGGGFGIVKRTARALIRATCGLEAREPISGQRALSPAARRRVLPARVRVRRFARLG